MLGNRFRGQVVGFTCDDILLDLTIPRVGKALGDPVRQLKKLLVRQFFNGFFDFSQRAHAKMMATALSPANRIPPCSLWSRDRLPAVRYVSVACLFHSPSVSRSIGHDGGDIFSGMVMVAVVLFGQWI